MRGVAVATGLQGSVLVPDQQGAPALFKWPGLFSDSMSSRGLLLAVLKTSVVACLGFFWNCAAKTRALRIARVGPFAGAAR